MIKLIAIYIGFLIALIVFLVLLEIFLSRKRFHKNINSEIKHKIILFHNNGYSYEQIRDMLIKSYNHDEVDIALMKFSNDFKVNFNKRWNE